MSGLSLPQTLRIGAAQVGVWTGVFALEMNKEPVSVEITAFNDGAAPAFISARLHTGAATDASVVERDYELPPGRRWWLDQIIRGGVMVEVMSAQPNVNFFVNGI